MQSPGIMAEPFGGALSVNLNTYLGSGRETNKHQSILKMRHQIHALELMHFTHRQVPQTLTQCSIPMYSYFRSYK